MTPEEREVEHVRQIRELIEETKSGILKRGKTSPSRARAAGDGDPPAGETVAD
jgi:hypothetical protein